MKTQISFQMSNIKYLEEKFYKSKSAMTAKLMERRREDVRDQMMDLSSSKGSAIIVQDPATQAEVAKRQRRAAEREGRRRRRLQVRVILRDGLWMNPKNVN